ncbi:hypothetical protein PS850_02077 [Pseudomonas fluorescens]|nr:hypothetical protein PS850_02077 [Pseudomonas fluorescens]
MCAASTSCWLNCRFNGVVQKNPLRRVFFRMFLTECSRCGLVTAELRRVGAFVHQCACQLCFRAGCVGARQGPFAGKSDRRTAAPTGNWIACKNCARRNTLWERACPRRGPDWHQRSQGSSIRSLSPGTVGQSPAAQRRRASSMAAGSLATKFQLIRLGPSSGAPPNSTA